MLGSRKIKFSSPPFVGRKKLIGGRVVQLCKPTSIKKRNPIAFISAKVPLIVPTAFVVLDGNSGTHNALCSCVIVVKGSKFHIVYSKQYLFHNANETEKSKSGNFVKQRKDSVL